MVVAATTAGTIAWDYDVQSAPKWVALVPVGKRSRGANRGDSAVIIRWYYTGVGGEGTALFLSA